MIDSFSLMRWAALVLAAGGTAACFICPVYQCGSNSPELYGHTIGPLSTNGAINQAGWQIVAKSLRGGGCVGAPLTLRVGNGELMGENDGGQIACTGAQLVGASFEIRQRDGTKRLWVANRNTVSTWELDGSLRRMVPTYAFQLESDVQPGALPGKRTALCTASPWMDPWQLKNLEDPGETTPNPPVVGGPDDDGPPIFANPPGIGGQPWGEPTVHAVVVQGEAYDGVGSIAASGAEWMSIGCAGRAIAKMRLLGLDPMCSKDMVGGLPGAVCGGGQRQWPGVQREATLKMLTARYRNNRSHTIQGTSLMWFSTDGVRYFGDAEIDNPRVGPIESLWTGLGAECLSHLRVSQGRNVSLQAAAAVREEEQTRRQAIRGSTMEACRTIQRSALAHPLLDLLRRGVWWVTFTYDHVSHPVTPGSAAVPGSATASNGAAPQGVR